jgi:hypothetical protein
MQDHHKNGTGVVHGGVLFTMADTAMEAALIPMLEKGQICATVEIKSRHGLKQWRRCDPSPGPPNASRGRRRTPW